MYHLAVQDVVMNHMGNEFFFEGHQTDTDRATVSGWSLEVSHQIGWTARSSVGC